VLVLAAAVLPNPTEELGELFKVSRNAEGFFAEAHAKLRPVDFASEGIYLCGTAHSPKLISESIAQALAATSRAVAFLSSTDQTIGGVVAQVVRPESCAACLVCVRRCPYNVPQINREDVSEINEALCQGCGICASETGRLAGGRKLRKNFAPLAPRKEFGVMTPRASFFKGYQGLVKEYPMEQFEPVIVSFCCTY
jgi:heterodisulfide reductase subunit A-like polyferredoxin